MIVNYLKVAVRVIFRNKAFSAINIIGLAFGITSATLLFLWVGHEFTYDQFHTDKDRIYIAWNRRMDNGQWATWSVTPRVLAPTLKDYANIELAVSYAQYSDSYLFSAGKKKVPRDRAQFVDPEFLEMFSFPLLKGEKNSALANPNAIVLTESFARVLYGDREAFGETITVSSSGEEFNFTITGILKDLPSNTDFDFEFLIPWHFLEGLGGKENNWYNNSVTTLIKVRPGTDIENLNSKVKDIKKRHTAGTDDTEVFLHPFTNNHLYSRFENGVPAGGRIETVRMLGILATCLIAIACINFINLSTARAQRRAKEVAVRKVSGAYRLSLVTQFLFESVLIALSAGLISLLAVYLCLPFFNSLVEQKLSLDFKDIAFWSGSLGIIIIVGVMAGSYPALYLSSFRPVGILKGGSISNSGKNSMRSVLVVLQFGFAIIMIISTIVVMKQIEFVKQRDTGYARDNLVYHSLSGDLLKNYQAYKHALVHSNVATSVTKTSSPITQRMSNTAGIQWKGKDPQDRTVIERFNVDEHILSTAGFTLIQGRDMDLQRFPSDSTAVLLNETAVNLMGFEQPVGEVILDNNQEWHVIGVIKDFILTSPGQKIEPMVILGGKYESSFNTIHIRLNPAHTTQENIARLSTLFSKYNPDYPFEYHFADIEYARKFSDMETTLTITNLFAAIAIFIACLGLLGLSTYMAESRIREIGIRKVLGGSVASIVKLLSWSSLKPILIATFLFSPVAWFAMRWWLESYAYRISLNIWFFILSGITVMLIAVITIAIQTIGAAHTNPANTLRAE